MIWRGTSCFNTIRTSFTLSLYPIDLHRLYIYALMQYLESFRWFGQNHPRTFSRSPRPGHASAFKETSCRSGHGQDFFEELTCPSVSSVFYSAKIDHYTIESYEVRRRSQQVKMECNWMCTKGIKRRGGRVHHVIVCSKFLLPQKSAFRSAAEEIKKGGVRIDLSCCI